MNSEYVRGFDSVGSSGTDLWRCSNPEDCYFGLFQYNDPELEHQYEIENQRWHLDVQNKKCS